MGKVAAAEMMKKKKGRPSLSDLRKRNIEQQQQQDLISSDPNLETPDRRSTRRNPNINGIFPESDWISGEAGEDDDDDERKEKKVKLVVRLPPFDHPQPRSSANSLSLNSASYGSDSNADGEKPKISHLAAADQVEMVQKATGTLQGSLLESGPTTPLPDKKFLVFILDRLQKKDSYGVFSEPVDPNELPDYHEVIEHPMDFGTVRKKLEQRRYSNLDEFEADVFLICSNAMQYNAPDTVYYRQARTIQDLAKRDFENLRQVNDDGEPQPKIVRRGRPPGKSSKKSLSSPPFERIGPESSSEATLATAGDNAVGSNSYNLRRAPKSYGFQPNDAFFRASYQSNDNETYADLEWNSEFPVSVLKAEAKHVKKQFTVDENKRATYRQVHPSAFGRETSPLTSLNGDMKQLTGVGLSSEHGYARSLARFAANLGPVVWKIAAKKIECALPTGVKFGPGWVGENEAPPRPPSALPKQKSLNNFVHDGRPLVTQPIPGTNSTVPYRSSLPCNEEMVDAVSGQTSKKELAASISGGASGVGPGTPLKQVLQNGFNGVVSGYDFSNQTSRIRLPMPAGHSGLEGEPSMPSPTLGVVSSSNTPSITPPMAANHTMSEPKLPVSSRSTRYEYVSAAGTTPDLNVRFQSPGSPSSSLHISSPQHPDLALQL